MKKLILTLFLLISVLSYAYNNSLYGKYSTQYIPSNKDYEKYGTSRKIKTVYYNLSLKKDAVNGISIFLEKTINADKEYVQLYIHTDLMLRKERNRYKLYKSSTGEAVATIRGGKIIYQSDGYKDLVLVKR